MYDVVLDKGALDALVSEDTESVLLDADQMFHEISRTLRHGGRYVCITLAQEHVLRRLISFFSKVGWVLRIVRLPATPESPLCPFMVVATSEKRENDTAELIDNIYLLILEIMYLSFDMFQSKQESYHWIKSRRWCKICSGWIR